MFLDKIGLFRKMLDISRELGIPKYWKTDLTTHDKKIILDLEPGRYFWIVRECGTHILNKQDAVRLLQTMCARALFTIRVSEVEDMHDIFETPIGSLYNLW